MFKIYFLFLFILLSSIGNLDAQNILTLEEAKQIALDNNYNAQISQHSLNLVENNTQLIKIIKMHCACIL